MRLKEFIVFIIFFTIIYFLGFYIYDRFMNKKSLEERETQVKSLFDINKYIIFCNFYGINQVATKEVLEMLYNDLKQSRNNDLKVLESKYSLSINEIIVAILFLEYFGLISKRKILISNSCCIPLSENDESLLIKYSLLFSNKCDYDSIIKRIGLNSDKELIYMSNNYLMPGVILNGTNISYVGDLDD